MKTMIKNFHLLKNSFLGGNTVFNKHKMLLMIFNNTLNKNVIEINNIVPKNFKKTKNTF